MTQNDLLWYFFITFSLGTYEKILEKPTFAWQPYWCSCFKYETAKLFKGRKLKHTCLFLNETKFCRKAYISFISSPFLFNRVQNNAVVWKILQLGKKICFNSLRDDSLLTTVKLRHYDYCPVNVRTKSKTASSLICAGTRRWTEVAHNFSFHVGKHGGHGGQRSMRKNKLTDRRCKSWLNKGNSDKTAYVFQLQAIS